MLDKKLVSKFLLKSLLFLVILFFLDYLIGGILRELYFKQDSGYLYRTTYAMDSTKADILIFGSSTANHHYYPDAFEKRLKMICYNTGRDGNSIFFNYAVLESVLKRYHPKIIILDFNLGEFKKESGKYDRISSLLPYCKKHPKLNSIAELKSPYEKYKMLSKVYPFNSLIFSILIGNLDYNKKRKYMDDDQGYVALTKIWNHKIATDTTSKTYLPDTNSIKIFKDFISSCIASKVKLYIVISPGFLNYTKKEPSIEIAHNIANKFSIPFFDFSRDTFFWDNPNLFSNENHLNDAGARIFSDKVIDSIIFYDQQLKAKKNDFIEIQSKK